MLIVLCVCVCFLFAVWFTVCGVFLDLFHVICIYICMVVCVVRFVRYIYSVGVVGMCVVVIVCCVWFYAK